MKYLFAIFVLLLPSGARAQSEIIVRLDERAEPSLVASLRGETVSKKAAFAGLFADVEDVSDVFPSAQAKKRGNGWDVFVLRASDAVAAARLLDRWRSVAGVRYAQPNYAYRLDGIVPGAQGDGIDDPYVDSLSHLSAIHVPRAWETTTGRPDVRIGFVDTGLYMEHPDLAHQIWINPGEDLDADGRVDATDFNGIDDDGNGFIDDVRGYDFVDRPTAVEGGDLQERDPDPAEDDVRGGGRGHGTIVAGALAAERGNGLGIAGVAPGCRLVPLRAFGPDGIGEDDDIAAAIVYAADAGIEVLNLSFGDVYYSPLMHEAIRYAVQRGTLVVASGGNAGGDAPHYPSDYEEVVSVAWLSQDGTGIAGRGTYGLGVDLGAPGTSIMTTLMPYPGEKEPAVEALYGRRSGSSLAAPLVAGTAALVRSAAPELSVADVRNVLVASATDVGEPGWDHRTGGGLVNAEAALRRLLPSRVVLSTPAQDEGIGAETVTFVGSAADPNFDSYVIELSPDVEAPDGNWTPIVGPVMHQVVGDTLGTWSADARPEGTYALRLAVHLRSGRTIEERRRVHIDRTPPLLTTRILGVGLVHGSYGIIADVQTDDLSEVDLRVVSAAGERLVASEKRARRHGLTWADHTGAGGRVQVELVATNSAGLRTTVDTTIVLPPLTPNSALLRDEALDVPAGYLLPEVTDFDGDGLPELVLNEYEDGWVGDTLSFYEWTGSGFTRAASVIANVIPRSTGDSDADGLEELLTQVAGATLVLEQPKPGYYPSQPSFVDTTGIANPFDPNAAFGARLTDLDGDGRGEILAHNTRQWRVLEFDGSSYREVARLDNPTGVGASEVNDNEFSQPRVLVLDMDGDGRKELVTGDEDGDWIAYEATGDDQWSVAWAYETDRYHAGSQFAAGDFDGDGSDEMVTFTQNWTQPTASGEREPDIGLYYLWDERDGQIVVVDTIPVRGPVSRHAAAAAMDVEGDGRDELVLAFAPDLYVLTFDDALHWSVAYEQGSAYGVGMRATVLTTGDVDGDGAAEIYAAGEDGWMHRFSRTDALGTAPPTWVSAVSRGGSDIFLAWRAPGADSTSVFVAEEGEPFSKHATVRTDSLLLPRAKPTRVVLRAWYAGDFSPLSRERYVRPHAPAVVERVSYPDPEVVSVRFSEPLHPETDRSQFYLASVGPPASLVLAQGGRAAVLRFEVEAGHSATLRWKDVCDAEGAPVAQDGVLLTFPDVSTERLYVTGWDVLDVGTIQVRFSLPLDGATASDPSSYRLVPDGEILTVEWSPEQAETVRLSTRGRALGAVGIETTLHVDGVRGARGEVVSAAGSVLLLTEEAPDLANVYVFPNPYREAEHASEVTIAGLPREAVVDVYSVEGEPVRRLTELDGDGGVDWDLKDERGRPVPSGVYFVRVTADGQRPVLRKAAVIR